MYEAAKKLFIKEITLSISIKCLLLMRGCHSCNIRTDLKTQSAGWLGNTASIVNTIIRVVTSFIYIPYLLFFYIALSSHV
jgi:hypothetical protein